MGCCYLPYFHVWRLRLEEILRTLVSRRASSHLHGDLVSVHQQVIPRPQQIRQLERGIRGATRRRDGRRFTFARRTSGDLVAKVYLVHHVTAVVADSSLALSIDVDTLRMMTHCTLPQRMIAQTMCVLSSRASNIVDTCVVAAPNGKLVQWRAQVSEIHVLSMVTKSALVRVRSATGTQH
jgi:NMD protein affecting ribosome stability and mRNA decay